jgi:hypothetical protein
MTYWHMQMHPNDKSFADEHVYSILEHKRIIGLGNWEEGRAVIAAFQDEMKVNDVVAIKNGAKLIALVQVIGGAYHVDNDGTEIGWIEYRRPIRMLDWELDEKTLPQPRGTLEKCVNKNAPTTQIISEWHGRVVESFKKRNLATTV